MVLFLMVYFHCYGCLWFLIISIDENWIPINMQGIKENEEFWDKPWAFYVAIALPCVMGITFALLLTSLPAFALKPQERV